MPSRLILLGFRYFPSTARIRIQGSYLLLVSGIPSERTRSRVFVSSGYRFHQPMSLNCSFQAKAMCNGSPLWGTESSTPDSLQYLVLGTFSCQQTLHCWVSGRPQLLQNGPDNRFSGLTHFVGRVGPVGFDALDFRRVEALLEPLPHSGVLRNQPTGPYRDLTCVSPDNARRACMPSASFLSVTSNCQAGGCQ